MGVNQIRIAGSMYAHTKLYNSNIVFVSSKEEVESWLKCLKNEGRKFCGVATLPLENISEDGVINFFWKVHTMLGLVVENGSNAQQKGHC